MNRELPNVQAGFKRDRGTGDQSAKICWIIEKAREYQKNIYCFLVDYAKAFDCVDHNELWKILQEFGIPDLPLEKSVCRLRNNRTGHGTTDWFQVGKGVCQGCILLPCLFSYMQSTSCKLLGWMRHKLESRLPR